MHNNLILLTITIATLFGNIPTKAEEIFLDGPVPATLVRVIDGDTVAVKAHIWLKQEVETLVRLRGIDAPEKRGRCDRERDLARQAHNAMEHLLGSDPVRLFQIGQDKYGGRVVARLVTQSGQDVAEHLLRLGLAHAYQGGTKQTWCPESGATG